jgi:nitrite reductase (NADH) small subunit
METEDCPVAREEELPEGARKTVKVGEEEVALFNVAGTLCAIANLCPHRGGLLGEGDLQGFILYCPLHAWAFDLRTGLCPSNPNARVRIFKVRLENGEIRVARSGTLSASP